jgi:hypothetical protein
MKKNAAKTIDEYLAGSVMKLTEGSRETPQTNQSGSAKAEECISYQIPRFVKTVCSCFW